MHDWGPAELTRSRDPIWELEARTKTLTAAPRCGGRLSQILKEELLPCLFARAPEAASVAAGLSADPDALACDLAAGRFAEARVTIERRLQAGATVQAILLEDLGPAARKLGDYWRDDDCDFLDVENGVRALRVLMRDLAPEERESLHRPAIVVTPAPGETHSFGADIVAALFRFAGWRTLRCEAGQESSALAREAFDIAAYSLSCDRYLALLPAAIREARAVSRSRRLLVVVGGPVFASMPWLAARVGADLCSPNGEMSMDFPQSFLRAMRL